MSGPAGPEPLPEPSATSKFADGRRSRVLSALSGAALIAASVCTRFGIFHGGVASARDPRYTVVPQRERADRRAADQV